MGNPILKYLFTAEYKDGTSYLQNKEDISILEPDKRSCFFDVKQSEVKRFWLEGEGHKYLVDLIDGHFEIDGVPFKLHDENLKDFRLIFFRRHRHQFNRETREELSHETTYRLGWQTNNEKGENIQRVMEIS